MRLMNVSVGIALNVLTIILVGAICEECFYLEEKDTLEKDE